MPTSVLPASGSPALDWAARSMPLLAATMAAHAEDFDGRHVGICLHIEPKTGVLVHWLLRVGARVTITGNLGTTDQATVDTLRALGATVLGGHDDDAARHARNLDALVAAEPDLLLDNGAESIERILRGGPRGGGFLGATEETTTGGRRLRELDVAADFPVVVINDSPLKLLIENEFGVGQSIVQGFMNATNAMLPGTRATVIGYGPCGKGVAETLARLGARVSVADTDPYRALEAIMHGHRVAPVETLLPDSQLVFLATGHPGVISGDQLELLGDGVMLIGVGHEADEIDLPALRSRARRITSLSNPSGDADARLIYEMADGREIVVLHGTKIDNLVARRQFIHPGDMDLGLVDQAAARRDRTAVRSDSPGPVRVPAPTSTGNRDRTGRSLET